MSAISNLSRHMWEVSKTLAPEYGPETPSRAVARLLEYYERLNREGKDAFVVALIGELVTQHVIARHRGEGAP